MKINLETVSWTCFVEVTYTFFLFSDKPKQEKFLSIVDAAAVGEKKFVATVVGNLTK